MTQTHDLPHYTASIIYKYFPALSHIQQQQLEQLYDLYSHWNAQINVISRKDMDNFYVHHVLHSLSLAKFIHTLSPQTKILDVGTGGGFPGVPMAILFPEVQFHLVDSIGKKIKVVNEVSSALRLENVEATHQRAEEIKDKYDFVISRAVTRLSSFIPWVQNKFSETDRNAMPNGIFYLKGGDLKEEIKEARVKAEIYAISDFFEEEFFDTKHIVYIPM